MKSKLRARITIEKIVREKNPKDDWVKLQVLTFNGSLNNQKNFQKSFTLSLEDVLELHTKPFDDEI